MKKRSASRIWPLAILVSLIQSMVSQSERYQFWYTWAFAVIGIAVYLLVSGIIHLKKLIKKHQKKIVDTPPAKESVWLLFFFSFLFLIQMADLNFNFYLFGLISIIVFFGVLLGLVIRRGMQKKSSAINYNGIILLVLLIPIFLEQGDYTDVFAFFGLIAYILINIIRSVKKSVTKRRVGEEAFPFFEMILCLVFCLIESAIFVGIYFGVKAIFHFNLSWITAVIIWISAIAGLIKFLRRMSVLLGFESALALVKKIFLRIGNGFKSFFRGITLVKFFTCVFLMLVISGLIFQTQMFSLYHKYGISFFNVSSSMLKVKNNNYVTAKTLDRDENYTDAEIYYLKAKEELSAKNSPVEVAVVDNALGVLYLNTERFKKSYAFLNSSYTTFGKMLGWDNINTKTSKFNLGVYFYKYGDYEQAFQQFGALLKSKNDSFAQKMAYANMSQQTLMEMGSFAFAKSYFNNTVRTYEHYYVPGVINREYMMALDNQAVVYLNLGEYEKGIQALKEAIKVHNGYSKEEDVDLALIYSNLAAAYSHIDNQKKVSEYNEKALTIYKKTYGENSINVANIYRSMGDNYGISGELDKQYECYQKALDVAVEAVGENNATVAVIYSSMSTYYNSCRNYTMAIECAEKSIEIRKTILSGESSGAASDYLMLAQCYKNSEMYDKAIEAATMGGNKYINIFGLENVHTARACLQLAQIYLLAGDPQKALNYSQNGVAFVEKAISRDCSIKADAYQALGYVFSETNHRNDAENYLKKSLDIYIASFGENHTAVSTTLSYLGDLYSDMENYESALTSYKRALAIENVVAPSRFGYVENTYHSIGFTQYKMKRYKDALVSYDCSLHMRERQIVAAKRQPEISLTLQYEGIANTLNNIAAVYEDTEEYQRAVEYELRAYRVLVDNGIPVEDNAKIVERLHRLHDKVSPDRSFDNWLKENNDV